LIVFVNQHSTKELVTSEIKCKDGFIVKVLVVGLLFSPESIRV